jgi:hypothetical protein
MLSTCATSGAFRPRLPGRCRCREISPIGPSVRYRITSRSICRTVRPSRSAARPGFIISVNYRLNTLQPIQLVHGNACGRYTQHGQPPKLREEQGDADLEHPTATFLSSQNPTFLNGSYLCFAVNRRCSRLLIHFATSAGRPQQLEVSHFRASLLSRSRRSYTVTFGCPTSRNGQTSRELRTTTRPNSPPSHRATRVCSALLTIVGSHIPDDTYPVYPDCAQRSRFLGAPDCGTLTPTFRGL